MKNSTLFVIPFICSFQCFSIQFSIILSKNKQRKWQILEELVIQLVSCLAAVMGRLVAYSARCVPLPRPLRSLFPATYTHGAGWLVVNSIVRGESAGLSACVSAAKRKGDERGHSSCVLSMSSVMFSSSCVSPPLPAFSPLEHIWGHVDWERRALVYPRSMRQTMSSPLPLFLQDILFPRPTTSPVYILFIPAGWMAHTLCSSSSFPKLGR